MKSFIATVEDVFGLAEKIGNIDAFDINKKFLQIPLYQREYKWDDEQIIRLLKDILSRDKFLGIIILNEAQDCYEIVDGQQRLTTLFLIFICLYNLLIGQDLDQEPILHNIRIEKDCYRLKNYSLSKTEFIKESAGRICLDIKQGEDQYYQKETLEHVVSIITNELRKELSNNITKLNEFKEKLLKCKLLILIYNQDNGVSVEQVFLDINEKSKHLSPDEIFKGRCFNKYSPVHYDRLRQMWGTLRKSSVEFSERFGYDDLSQFIYLYLIGNKDIDIDTNYKKVDTGDHVLQSMSNTEIDNLIKDMNEYGRTIIEFSDRLSDDDYYFSDLICDAEKHKNDEKMLNLLKILCKDIVGKKSNKYQKVPFFFLVYKLITCKELSSQLNYSDLKRIISSLYIYAKLFSFDSTKKSKKDIDHTVYHAIDTDPKDKTKLLQAINGLRRSKTDEFIFTEKYSNYDKLSLLYSIVDYYDKPNGCLSSTYNDSQTHINNNLEHLVIPNNNKRKIKWAHYDALPQSIKEISKKNCIDIVDVYDLEFEKKCKKKAIDYVIIDKNLNNYLRNYDIVTKLFYIENFYRSQGNIPAHISFFIKSIRGMSEFAELESLKNEPLDINLIKSKYSSFLDSYFNQKESEIISEINTMFHNKFS